MGIYKQPQSNSNERDILRDLAKQYFAITQEPVQNERRHLWRQHNSLKATRPLIYTRAYAWHEMPFSKLTCVDPLFRHWENYFRRLLFWHSLDDDSIFEPWIAVRAAFKQQGWGFNVERHISDEERGSFKVDYPIKSLDDFAKMVTPAHIIDEEQTRINFERMQEAIGDIIPVTLDLSPIYSQWVADLSTDLGYLRGIEHFMLDMLDNPEWLHSVVAFMSRGILKAQAEAETAGDWNLCAHNNQAMTYAEELSDPAPGVNGIKRSQLWCFMAAQEFTAVSPAMHEEFLLRYQMPIMSQFGLVAYGCCEDLTNKISMLRSIPNLRRIAVAPFANVARCAEQIGTDYVLSYRPSPTDMVGYGFNIDRIRGILKRDLTACRGTHVDITLKDVETVEHDPERVRKWVALTRAIIDEIWG